MKPPKAPKHPFLEGNMLYIVIGGAAAIVGVFFWMFRKLRASQQELARFKEELAKAKSELFDLPFSAMQQSPLPPVLQQQQQQQHQQQQQIHATHYSVQHPQQQQQQHSQQQQQPSYHYPLQEVSQYQEDDSSSYKEKETESIDMNHVKNLPIESPPRVPSTPSTKRALPSSSSTKPELDKNHPVVAKLMKHTVEELRAICKQHRVLVKGAKVELIARLLPVYKLETETDEGQKQEEEDVEEELNGYMDE